MYLKEKKNRTEVHVHDKLAQKPFVEVTGLKNSSLSIQTFFNLGESSMMEEVHD